MPVGLCGVLSSTSRVRAVTAAASSPGSKLQSGGRSVTTRRFAPAIAMLAAYESYSGSKTITSSPGSSSPSIVAAIASVAPKVTCTSSTSRP